MDCPALAGVVTAMRAAFALRSATAQDASLLARIHRQARAAAMPWLPVLHTTDEDIAWMTNVVLAKQQVIVAASYDFAHGYIALTDGWVEHLYIDPPSWRTGAGSALLNDAKRRLPDGFRLWTFQRNVMARAFYRKHGLAELRRTDGYDNEEKEPDVLLGWKLTS
jgi:GNAT superfamily N-acetyltransferase